MKPIICFLFCISALIRSFGGSISENQIGAENDFSASLCLGFRIYQGNHGVLPTNWKMLHEVFSEQGWNTFEERFRKFGDKKGFTNSIFEKYVFLNPPIKVASYKDFTGYAGPVSPSEQGDILFMSAKPFQQGTNWFRWALFLRGTNVESDKILERRVQKSFELAGRTIPVPPASVPVSDQRKPNEASPRSSIPSQDISQPPEIRADTDLSDGTSEINLPTNSESGTIAQTTSPTPWKIIAVAAFILLLLGWMVFRRKQKR